MFTVVNPTLPVLSASAFTFTDQGNVPRASVTLHVPAQVPQPAHTSGLLLIAATAAQVFAAQLPLALHPEQLAQSPSESAEQAFVGQVPSEVQPQPTQLPSAILEHPNFWHIPGGA